MNDASLLQILKARFDKHPERHAAIGWSEVQARLERKRSINPIYP